MDENSWNTLIASFPDPHVLQTWQWSRVKAGFDWHPNPIVWRDRQGEIQAAAMTLMRTVPLPLISNRSRVMYVPKGPLLRNWNDAEMRLRVYGDLRSRATQCGAIFIKIDPDVRLGIGVPGEPDASENQSGHNIINELKMLGWRFSGEQVQFRNTVLIDLSASEEHLLANMKQKTRYNIRLANRKGVKVRSGDKSDIGLLFDMYTETSIRDRFVIRNLDYYRAVWETFIKAGMAVPLIAEVDRQPVAAVMFFHFAGRAWYMYGMSRSVHREKMANYLLQWEAIKIAKTLGCKSYDLWGAPDKFVEGNPLWGVYRFKQGLGGEVVRHIGAWDLPVRPFYYRIYTQFLPRLLTFMRARGGRARIKDQFLKG